METIIAGRSVPVLDGLRTVVHFTAGCNPNDYVGNYEFWTVRNNTKGFYGRWPEGRGDPGSRAREMEGNPGYEKLWAIAATAIVIQPTTENDLIQWLNTHLGDAPCATTASIEGKLVSVVKRDGRYNLEATSIGA